MIKRIEQVVWTLQFERDFKRIKDSAMKDKLKKQIKRVIENPEIGKPLRYSLRGERTIYAKPYRMVYAFSGKTLFLLRFAHRKRVYKG